MKGRTAPVAEETMTDQECLEFLQWALPQFRMRWDGFRKVRRQVHKRIDRRLAELGLDRIGDYRSYLAPRHGTRRP